MPKYGGIVGKPEKGGDMKWKKIKLGEVIFKKNLRMKDAPEIIDPLVLGVTNNEGVVISKVEAGQKIEDYFIVNKGDFVYNPYRINVGSIGISEYDGITSLAYVVFNVDEDKINKYLLFKFLKSEFGVKEIIKNGRGSVRNALRFEDLSKIEIYLPPIEVQNTFIENFKKQEYKSNLLNRQLSHQLTLLDQLNQAILQEAVQGKLVPQDPNDEPASELLKRIKAEKLNGSDPSGRRKKEKPLPPIKPEEIPFDIPENWVWCRLGEITDIQRGSSPRPKGDPRYFSKSKTNFNWITISDISNFCENNVLIQTREFLTEEGSKHSRYVDVNEFIIAVSGSTTGKCCITGIEGFIYDGLAVAKIIDNSFDARYLLNYMMCLYTTINNSKTGASFPNINTDYLNSLIFPLPPIKEQKRINKEIEKQLAKTKQLKEHIIANQQATELLLKALLHQAFEVKEMEEVNN
jgi:type I restriction enzyme S subunit